MLKMKKCLQLIFQARTFCSQSNIPKVSVIGAGPAGFYAAQYLLKNINCELDIYEKLPTPFGLVRYGVAPDHPEVKNVQNTFSKVAQNPQVRFVGNVNFGNDINLNDLITAYNIVILAYGAEKNKILGIPGENLRNVISARKIVGWYNGLPWEKNISIDLSGDTVAIFGQGNVAIDVARILLTPVDELRKTDITQHSLEALSKSKIKTVYLIGRRGPLQAAFTIKELREMLNLKNASTDWLPEDFHGLADVVNSLPRPRKRITELMLKSLKEKQVNMKEQQFKPIFYRTPLEFVGRDSIDGVKLGVNRLEGNDWASQRAVLTELKQTIECNLSVVSIGYESISADPNLAFDKEQGVVQNKFGKVQQGVYATGWLATGPMGVILSTMNHSFNLGESIIQDVKKNDNLMKQVRPGFSYIKNILNQKNIQTVDWNDWLKIDKHEIAEGRKLGKPREKITDINEMLRIASL